MRPRRTARVVALPAILFAATARAEPVAPHDAPRDAMPDRTWDFEHVHLAVRVDPNAGTVQGTVEHHVVPLVRPSSWVRLHQIDLDVTSVSVDGAPVASFRLGPDTLDVPVAPGVPHVVSVAWRATPETGMHFRRPSGSADRVVEAWTQGEDEDNRYWFPGWDHPNDRFTVALDLTVPEGLHAVANGSLLGSAAADPGWTTWSYALEQDLVNYLVVVAVGDYVVYREDGPVPLEYVVARGTSEEVARRSLGFAKDQLTFFGDLLGRPYPYPVYRQVAVARFLYGAMENTTTTLIGDGFLLRRPDAPSGRTESVVAHELAHQWFGDLLTCYGWRELWLNEGFATFYAARWMEHVHGPESAAVWNRRRQKGALGAAWPMAPRGWSVDGERANGSVYDRGATVLHMLRVFLGEAVFDEGIRRYVATHANSLVESDDLRRSLEDVSGIHLGWLFDRWVHGPVAPAMRSSWRWNEGHLEVTVAPKGDDPVYAPVEVEIGTKTAAITKTVWTGEAAVLEIDLDEPPLWVSVDPRGGVLANWEHDQSNQAWTEQVLHSPSPYARVVALEELQEGRGGPKVLAALRQLLLDSRLHHDFRARVAETLGAFKSVEAADVLISGLGQASAEVRAACAERLKGALGDAAVTALTRFSQRDPSPDVRAAALQSLGSVDSKRALGFARKLAARAWSPAIEEELVAALDVLGRDGDARDLVRLLAYTGPKVGARVRREAGSAVAELVRRMAVDARDPLQERASKALIPWLDDPDLRVREQGVSLLGRVGNDEATSALLALASRTALDGLRESARDAAAKIRAGEPDAATPPSVDDLERIEERMRELEKRIEEVERWR